MFCVRADDLCLFKNYHGFVVIRNQESEASVFCMAFFSSSQFPDCIGYLRLFEILYTFRLDFPIFAQKATVVLLGSADHLEYYRLKKK